VELYFHFPKRLHGVIIKQSEIFSLLIDIFFNHLSNWIDEYKSTYLTIVG
jgi:hypothetical protein